MIKYHILDLKNIQTYGIIGEKDLTIKTDYDLLTQFNDGEDLWHRSPDYVFLCKWETDIKTLEKMIRDAYTNIKTFKQGKFDCFDLIL